MPENREALPRRSATIDIAHLSTGYWGGKVVVRIPGLPDQEFSGDLFHTAPEALDWARLMIAATVAHVS